MLPPEIVVPAAVVTVRLVRIIVERGDACGGRGDITIDRDRHRSAAVVEGADAEETAGDGRPRAGRDGEVRARGRKRRAVLRIDAGNSAAGNIAIGGDTQRPAAVVAGIDAARGAGDRARPGGHAEISAGVARKDADTVRGRYCAVGGDSQRAAAILPGEDAVPASGNGRARGGRHGDIGSGAPRQDRGIADGAQGRDIPIDRHSRRPGAVVSGEDAVT